MKWRLRVFAPKKVRNQYGPDRVIWRLIADRRFPSLTLAKAWSGKWRRKRDRNLRVEVTHAATGWRAP